ncbi:MAG TPA: glucohydrolase [Lachnospiraceae bacterium]|nr:glucohydrolase [Lachnospiraceae bacterium]
MKEWYKKMAFYQIWIRSFYDGNGDGIGDLYGVYEKLEYIKSLGVDGIWFSPIYPSPNADYGYDISDYKNIHEDYGDLDQFKKVLDKAHELGLKVIMDLVINHTSDEHEWFKESRKSRNNPYSDYYIWRDAKDGKLPNNWDSLFEGKAWEYVPERDQYYLHIFAKKQPDLNMDNPKVREEVKSIMRFWLDMGVDGFREDVITFISKVDGLPDGNPLIPMANGMKYYKDGPHIHEYLAEFREVAKEYDCFLLGEGPMTTTDSALNYMSGPGRTLDLMFHFEHMMADCFMTEYIQRPFSLTKLKKAFSKWQYELDGKAWNTLYLENHDHPRIISRYGDDKKYHRASGTMLAACYLFQKGTPFIYQGQEIGMTNIRLKSIDQYIDVSSKTNYHRFHTKDPVEKRMERIYASSRDSARTPMQWDDSENAGFSSAKPWFYVNPNYRKINVKAEEADKYSILNFYRKCLNYRKNSDVILWGKYKEFFRGDNYIYMYERSYKGKSVLVVCSFADHEIKWRLPKAYAGKKGKLVICNYRTHDLRTLKPYEARVYEINILP